ncbi:hypothetical protein GCM10010353_37470 [Streptomyces chryseus]|nr:hypothetical protein GCM10010353_37470 [Streptomyces chryseus]
MAVDTGWPSERRAEITAGFGFVSIAITSSGNGGFDMGSLLTHELPPCE